MTEAYQLFDQALAAFKTGDYRNALVDRGQSKNRARFDNARSQAHFACSRWATTSRLRRF